MNRALCRTTPRLVVRAAIVGVATAEVTDSVVQRHVQGALRDALGAAGAARPVACSAVLQIEPDLAASIATLYAGFLDARDFSFTPGLRGQRIDGQTGIAGDIAGDIALDRDQWRRRSARDTPQALNDRVNEHAQATLPGAVGMLGVQA